MATAIATTKPAPTAGPVTAPVAAPAADRSVLARFTDTVSLGAKKAAEAVDDAADEAGVILTHPIAELKKIVDSFMGWVGLSMITEMNRRDDRERARREEEKTQFEAVEARYARVGAQLRAEGQKDKKAA